MAGPALFYALCEFQHGAFSHTVAEVIGPGSNKDRWHKAVFPVVVVSETPQGRFYAADNHRDVRIQLLEDLGVYRYGVIRTRAGFAVRGIGVVVTETLGGGIMIHH